MAGHRQLDDSSLIPIYEFLHLSFQEYLTAKAVEEKSLPSNLHDKSNLEILKPYLLKENWKEIIPLVAVLSKRDNKGLIEYLIDESKKSATIKEKKQKRLAEHKYPPSLLGNCIANEIQINPELLKKALEWYAKNRYNLYDERITEIIINGKFGIVFQEVIEKIFFSSSYNDDYSSEVGGLLGEVFILKLNSIENCYTLKEIEKEIYMGDKIASCIGISALMSYAFNYITNINEIETCEEEKYYNIVKSILNHFLKLLKLNDNHYKFLIAWAIAWIYNNDLTRNKIEINDELICELINIWLYSDEYNLKRVSGWALNQVFNAKKDILNYINTIEYIEERILEKYKNSDNEYDE